MDLNHRPLGYEPNELPDCSTPRFDDNNRVLHRQTPRRDSREEFTPRYVLLVARQTLSSRTIKKRLQTRTKELVLPHPISGAHRVHFQIFGIHRRSTVRVLIVFRP